MKNWIINENELTNKYLIVTEKSIWISEQLKELDINELIENKNLGTVKSFRYEEIKEMIFIETNVSIQFEFKNKKTESEKFVINKNVFREIKTYLKNQLGGIQVKNYSLFKQVLPQLTTLGIGIVFIALTYSTALDLENGIEIPESRKSSIIKKIVLLLAELLGVYGSIVFGILFLLAFIFWINKKLQNPKKGEILKFNKNIRLKK
jgi:Na+-transporting methylmalonyl-CoA/oxaloacetate decarboxylase gamma subunit